MSYNWEMMIVQYLYGDESPAMKTAGRREKYSLGGRKFGVCRHGELGD